MAGERTPCITYCRQRESEPEANRIALERQNDAETKLENAGYSIVGRFGDAEFAPPFLGWLEPRPGWDMALSLAQTAAGTAGSCVVVILYADGIGEGDPFLPDIAPNQIGAVEVLVCNFGFSSGPEWLPLTRALKAFSHNRVAQEMRWVGTQCSVGTNTPKNDIVFEHNIATRTVRAYFCNYEDQPLRMRWQRRERLLLDHGTWAIEAEWREIMVAAASKLCLAVFLQFETRPVAHWWRFKCGTGRATKACNALITSAELGSGLIAAARR